MKIPWQEACLLGKLVFRVTLEMSFVTDEDANFKPGEVKVS